MTKSSLLLAVSAPVLLAAGAFHRSSVQDQPPVPEPRDAHVSYAEFEPQPGREAELEQLVVEVTRGLEGQAGLLRYAVLREESGLVRVFSAWENDEAWEHFTESGRYGEMHGA